MTLSGTLGVDRTARAVSEPMNIIKSAFYGIAAESFLRQRSGAVSQDLAAWLATPATLRELPAAFGLTHPDSVRNLIRRADRALLGSRRLCGKIEAIRHRLSKTAALTSRSPALTLRSPPAVS